MLATLLHFLKGTPYIYQGEEIGMTNVKFDNLDDYDDIETYNFYKENLKNGFSHDNMMKAIWENGRDNARTPMQWDNTENAGFTTNKPWLKVNSNYKSINVKEALADNNSIFYHYKELIKLRKDLDVIVYGDFKLIFENHPSVFAYIRSNNHNKILVVCNATPNEVTIELPKSLTKSKHQLLISNYEIDSLNGLLTLRPYEAFAFAYNL